MTITVYSLGTAQNKGSSTTVGPSSSTVARANVAVGDLLIVCLAADTGNDPSIRLRDSVQTANYVDVVADQSTSSNSGNVVSHILFAPITALPSGSAALDMSLVNCVSADAKAATFYIATGMQNIETTLPSLTGAGTGYTLSVGASANMRYGMQLWLDACTITSVTASVKKTLAPSYVLYARIYDIGGTLVGTIGSKTEADFTTSFGEVTWSGTNVSITTPGVYRIVLESGGWNATNYYVVDTANEAFGYIYGVSFNSGIGWSVQSSPAHITGIGGIEYLKARDKAKSATGTSAALSTGASATLDSDTELGIGVGGMEDKPADQTAAFTAGASNLSGNEQTTGTTGSGDASNVVVRSCAEILAATTAQTAAISLSNSADWAALEVFFFGSTSGGATNLTIENSKHVLKSGDAVVTTQIPLTIENSKHLNKSTDANLTQLHILTVENARHAHQSGDVSLSQISNLVIQNSTHSPKSADLSLTQLHNLQIGNSFHAHKVVDVGTLYYSACWRSGGGYTYDWLDSGDISNYDTYYASFISSSGHLSGYFGAKFQFYDNYYRIYGGLPLGACILGLNIRLKGYYLSATTGTNTLTLRTEFPAEVALGNQLTITDEPTSPATLEIAETGTLPNYTQLMSSSSQNVNVRITGTASVFPITFYLDYIELEVLYKPALATLVIENSSHTLQSDQPVMSQAQVLATQDSTHTHRSGDAPLTQVHNLTVEVSKHLHTAGDVILQQVHNLQVETSHHHLASDEPSFTGSSSLQIEAAQHTLKSGDANVTVTFNLVIEDSFQGGKSEEPALEPIGLDQVYVSWVGLLLPKTGIILTIENSKHALKSGDVILGAVTALTIENSSHALKSEDVALTKSDTLVIQNSSHSHQSGEITLAQQHNLQVENSFHTQSAADVVLGQLHSLQIENSYHADKSSDVSLTQLHILVIENSRHTHTVGDLLLGQIHNLVIEGSHEHLLSGDVQLTINFNLTIENSKHALKSGDMVLVQTHVLQIGNSQHTLKSEECNLYLTGDLQIDNSRHTHRADEVALSTQGALTIEDSRHTHTASEITITTQILLAIEDSRHTLKSNDVVPAQTYNLLVENSHHHLTDTGNPCVVPIGTLAEIRHETGDFSEYDATYDPAGGPAISVSTAAGLVNTEYGLAVNIDGVLGEDPVEAWAEITLDQANYSGSYSLRFYIDTNNITLPLDGTGFITIGRFYTSTGVIAGEIRMLKAHTGYWYFQLAYWDNSGAFQSTPITGDNAPPFYILIRFYRQSIGYIARVTVVGADYVGSATGSSNNHDNTAWFTDLSYVRLGALYFGGAGLTYAGEYYIDEIKLNDTGLGIGYIFAPAGQDSRHAHKSDGVNLTQQHNLQIEDSRHLHTSEQLLISGNLVIEDSYHAHRSEKVYFVTILVSLTLPPRSFGLHLEFRDWSLSLSPRYQTLHVSYRDYDLSLAERSTDLHLPYQGRTITTISQSTLVIGTSYHTHTASEANVWPGNQLMIEPSHHTPTTEIVELTVSNE